RKGASSMNPGVPPSSHQRLNAALDAAATAQEWDAMQAEARERGVGVLTVQRERLAEAEAARRADAARVNALIARYGSYDAIVAAAERERTAQQQATPPAGPPSVGRSVSPPAWR
ncbi:MAG TPA: hypothetical protein VGS80_04150, partial [Ktedonobacterales bacterium]|nr:hypothetical protein [Ktedonobacterales bacterium]